MGVVSILPGAGISMYRGTAIMQFNKLMRHIDGRSREIYRAKGWGKTRSNVFIGVITSGEA